MVRNGRPRDREGQKRSESLENTRLESTTGAARARIGFIVTGTEVDVINEQASALMQRGIAFMEEARREAVIDALHCFDEALALRRQIPANHSPFQAYLLAACLLNRADALVRFNDAGPLAAALASYDEAIDVLSALPMAEDPLYPRRLAMACHNRGLACGLAGSRGTRRRGGGVRRGDCGAGARGRRRDFRP